MSARRARRAHGAHGDLPAAARALRVLLAALPALIGGACVRLNTQRWPGPMENEVRPLPPGDTDQHPPGAEEVTVVRHADPVRIRPAGVANAWPLAFYEKQARLTAGGQVSVAAGGRAEVLFPDGGSIVLFGNSVAWIGSPSRGEPICDLRAIEAARVMLSEGDQIRLVGGSVLSGAGGPYLLAADQAGTLAVHNQSKGSVAVAFREEVFELGPGQQVVLPLLSSGGTPAAAPEGLRRVGAQGFNVDVLGPLDAVEGEQGLALSASGAGEALGFGVRVRLAPGAQATFGGLGRAAEAQLAAGAAPGEPAAEPAEPVAEDPPSAEPATEPDVPMEEPAAGTEERPDPPPRRPAGPPAR